MKSVLVIVLNWNGWRDTVECLTSLEKLNYRNFQVVVIDNGSTDDSVLRIRLAFPGVSIIEAKKNLGFAGGCNLGIRHALEEGAEYVWLLNNDTTVDPDALVALVQKAEADPQVGAVGSAIYSAVDPDRLLAWGGGRVNFWLGRSRHFLSSVPDSEIQFLTGASLLLTRSVLESVGLLDEGFFMYWEDADYCFRLRRASWKLAAAGDSKVWHKEQGSSERKGILLDDQFNRSASRFFSRHAPIPIIPVGAGTGLRIAKRIFIGDWKRARALWESEQEQ